MRKMKNLGVIAMFLVIILSCNRTSDNDKLNDNVINSLVKSPFPNLDINYTNYSVNSQKDTVLISKTGSRINIPKNAFCDKDGNIINGNIDIKYREYSNAFDIYLGGIPMQYDSAGTNMVFETAGMLEINVTFNNEQVFVNKDNKISIDMNSFEQGNKYNLYQLDTLTGKWENIGKDIIEQKNYAEEIAKLPIIPPEPKKETPFSFSIGDDTDKYPEISMYENVLFEPVNGKSCGFDCTEIKVKDLNNGKYEITFIFDFNGKKIKEEKCICYLAFKEGADYDNAIKKYKRRYASLIAKRTKAKIQIEKEWDNYRNTIKAYNIGVFNINSENINPNQRIIRTLEINNFGFINCDYPSSYPSGATLIAKFVDEKDNRINLKNIVLIEKGRNALFRYTNKIKFNPSKENILWGITDDGYLAYFNSNDFKNINSYTGDYVFKMNIHYQELKTYDDITNVLFN